MKPYLSQIEADLLLTGIETLEYPHQAANKLEFPLIEPQPIGSDGEVMSTGSPHDLVIESVHLFGKEPKNIIDIGCSTGLAALYLATQGHIVTAIDINDDVLEFSMERAKKLNIDSKNFIPIKKDLCDLTTSDKYEGVISINTIHCVEEQIAMNAIKKFQEMTTPDGIDIISVYTEDNPLEEINIRGLQYMFKKGELSKLYQNQNWRTFRNIEGYQKPTIRGKFFGLSESDEVLIPSVAEIVSIKNFRKQTTYMNANRQIIVIK